MGQQRNIKIDIVKGLAIILMVIGHTENTATDNIATQFIYLFHMAMFFIASGYLYKTDSMTNFNVLRQYIVKKVQSLWIPYAIFSLIFLFSHNVFVTIYIYDAEMMSGKELLTQITRIFLFRCGTEMGGAFWFLSTLFTVVVGFAILDFFLLKFLKTTVWSQAIIAAISLGIAYVCMLNETTLYNYGELFTALTKYNFARIFSAYSVFYLGILLRRFDLLAKIKNCKQAITLVFISFCCLLLATNIGSVGMAANQWKNPLFFIVVSLLGWVMLYESAMLLQKKDNMFVKLIVFAGHHSIFIVALHFLSFKIISLFGVLALDMPLQNISAFPVLFTDGWWWMPYTIVGVGVPLLVAIAFYHLKEFFFYKSKRNDSQSIN